MAGIEGLDAGDVVKAEQMRFLFGEGRHPLAGQLAGLEELSTLPLRSSLGATAPVIVGAALRYRRERGVAVPA